MRYILLFLTCLFISISISNAQTELWRVPRYGANILTGFPRLLHGDNGNIYIDDQDTIKKVDTDGNILWSHLIETHINIFFTDLGLYVLHSDSITTLDLNGSQSSTIATGSFSGIGCIDTHMNLYCYETTSDGLSIIKMDINGTIQKEFKLPALKYKNNDNPLIENIGPFIDPSGNIWAIRKATAPYETARDSREEFYIEAYKFDGSTGALVFHKTPVNRLLDRMEKETSRGSSRYLADFETVNFSFAGDYLVFCANIFKQTYKITSNKTDEKYDSEWRAISISPTGKIKTFKHQAKGTYIIRDKSNPILIKGEDDIIGSITSNSGGIYITGWMTKGKSINDVGTFSYYGVVLKLNAADMKIAWQNVFPGTSGSSTSPMIGVPILSKSEKIYVPSRNWEHTIYVYNKDGDVDATPLTFTDNLNAVNTIQSSTKNDNLQSANLPEDGFLYLELYNETTHSLYLAKFALPVSKFAATNSSDLAEEPYQFNLNQNYPNPFNPTTTIDFSLAEASIVTLKVYNILGQEVAALIDHEIMDEGDQTIEFDASRLPSGVYFYDLLSNSENGHSNQSIKKMMLMK